MCDFKIVEKALKIAWVNRIQDESQASWKIIPNLRLHKHGCLAFLTKCNFVTNTLDPDEKLPSFSKKKMFIRLLLCVQNINGHRTTGKIL